MAIAIKDIIERVAKSKGVEPVDLMVSLIGNLLFGSSYLNISPDGEVKVVGSIINELNQVMRMTQATELPPSIYAAVESMAGFWVTSDRQIIEKEKANGTNRFPVEQLNKHEALLLILRDVRNESERTIIEHSLHAEDHMKQYGVPPFFKKDNPDQEEGNG